MSKTIQYLALALIAQALILATVLFTKNQGTEVESISLLDFEVSAVDSLIIGDGSGELEIQKQDGQWSLPGYGGLSVKTEKVNEVLDELAKLKTNWPVASSDEAADRFEVTVSNAQKSIKLKSGDEIVAKLYLGTSPGFRKVHTRAADDKNIYALEFSQYRISTKGEDWFDKNLLSYSGTINSVQVGDTTLTRDNENWQVSTLDTETVDSTKVENWIKNLGTLQVSKLVTGNEKDKLLVTDVNLEIQVDGDKGLALYKLWQKDDKYFIKRSEDQSLFEIATYQAKKYFELDLASFAIDDTSDETASDTIGLPAESPPSTEAPGSF